MKYRILWIDDSPDWVDPMKESIKDHLIDLGIELVVALFPDWKGATEHLDAQNVDLIAVDYNLKGLKGDEVIGHIREKEKYAEILFYTAAENYLELLTPQDGVYRASRVGVEESIKKLIGLTLKRVQSPANMRGLVIAEILDIEALIEEILVANFGEKGELFRVRVLSKGVFDFKKKYDLLSGILKDRITACNVEAKGGGEKAEAAKQLVEHLNRLKNTLDQFDSEVIETRNILAHVREEKDELGRVTLKNTINKRGGTITIDHDWCVKIRKDLAKHRQALETVLASGIG